MTKKDLLITNLSQTPDFPRLEEKIADFWEEAQIFQKTLTKTEAGKPWIFYDGPPFATGLPHYGHLVASTTKDVFPRFQTMLGRYVKRIWGWDCHGLPIENIVEKEFNLKNRREIEKYGIGNFCEGCSLKVMTYAKEWKKTIKRLGRFVDMEHDYKTMDVDFMENVWDVFKKLWEKGLIYKDYKPMHICPRCGTPLSNFEVTQGYKDITDISIYVEFPLKNMTDLLGEKPAAMLAWTTTPWTLPGNFLLAINPEAEYSVVEEAENSSRYLIVASERLTETLAEKQYEVKTTLKGLELVGREYEPAFPYFAQTVNAFRVVDGDFVTMEDGTGVVHIAPAFGENDFYVGKREQVPIVHHVDFAGNFTAEVTDFAGMEVRKILADEKEAQPADIAVIKYLAEKGKIWRKQKIKHSYPHCWRCDHPLLNYATASYFVKVTDLKDDLLKNNELINWQPEHLKNGRFGKWLAGARDWAISRNRFWGTPLPLWVSEVGDFLCVGSKAELEELSGQKIADLHKNFVDKIIIEKNGKKYHRIDEVLDCWFESGSMPYASAKNFPADFISEGQDQTRGWFYTLHVLATALKNEPAFKNVLVNGIILAEDGKKMSKKLHNYPEPEKIFNEYGADALRLYLMTSPVMKAENLNFEEKEVGRLRRQVEVILWNVLVFWQQAGGKFEEIPAAELPRFDELPLLDQDLAWKTSCLITEMTVSLQTYDVVRAGRLLIEFIDDLSTFYVRLSRDRLKDNAYSRTILGNSLLVLSKLMAPIMPFFAELIYQNLGGKLESVHLEDWPHENAEQTNDNAEKKIILLKKILETGRSERKITGIKVRQPLANLILTLDQEESDVFDSEMEKIIMDELNVKNIAKEVKKGQNLTITFDTKITEELKNEGEARELIREIASERKRLGLTATDDFEFAVNQIPHGWQAEIERKTRTKLVKKI